jgi:hypothetical protein
MPKRNGSHCSNLDDAIAKLDTHAQPIISSV